MFLYYFSIIFYFSTLFCLSLLCFSLSQNTVGVPTKNPPPIPQPPLTKKEKKNHSKKTPPHPLTTTNHNRKKGKKEKKSPPSPPPANPLADPSRGTKTHKTQTPLLSPSSSSSTARLNVLLRTCKSNQDPPQPNQDPKSQNQIKTQNRIKDLIACRFVLASHDRSPIRPKKNHAKKKKKRRNLHHRHQTTAIGIPQSSEHNHRQSSLIGEAQREKREERSERKEKDRVEGER